MIPRLAAIAEHPTPTHGWWQHGVVARGVATTSAWISRAFANVPSLAKSMWHSSRVYSPAT
eukprot:scaffold220343_cov25-Tisochrysis_lutea.AAC.2